MRLLLIQNIKEHVDKFQMVKMVQEVMLSEFKQSPKKNARRNVIANLIAQIMSTIQGKITVKFGLIWP